MFFHTNIGENFHDYFQMAQRAEFFSFVQEIDPKKLQISQCQARNCLEKAKIDKCNRKRGRH